MKKILILLMLLMGSEMIYAQQFQKKTEMALPDSIREVQSAWVDLDNDGLLDILMAGRTNTNRSHLFFVKGDTINTPQLKAESTPIIDFKVIDVIDYDLDNDMDVIVSGKKNGADATVVYINNGSFQFEEHVLNVPTYTIGKFADLDNNARPEWIISGVENGTAFTKILKQEQDYMWKVVHDSIKFSLTSIEVMDANGDGRFDLFVSGLAKPDSLVSGFLINQNSFYFKPDSLIFQLQGTSSTADVNQDSFFDILITGKDLNGVDQTKLYQSQNGKYSLSDYPLLLKDAQSFMADLNSDGIVDVNYLGKNNLGDTLNINYYGDQDYDTLNSSGLIVQYFGDAEHDGDLDLVQLIQREVLYLVLYENKPQEKNDAPMRPPNAVALPIFNRAFLYWDKPNDDHTPTSSLTFDVFINGNSEYQVGSFDLLNEKRLSVSHGNNSTENFRLLRVMPNVNLTIFVQSIDNAFHADPASVCVGGGGAGGVNCTAVIETNTLAMCTHESVILKAPHDVLWFSFAEGFEGSASEFNFQADQPDTIFSFDPHSIASGCAALKAWTLKINNDTIKTELATRFACPDTQLNFEVEQGWDIIKWKSDAKGDLGSTASITYIATVNDTVAVTLKNIEGCTIQRKTAVRISKPELVLAADQYKILKGGSVSLNVNGADHYVWSPSSFLNSNDIPNPVATPNVTIQYTVTGYDSINCSSQAIVTIVVEDTGFVPTLFTPNNDTKNDELKIYGLSSANNFSFEIFNREGSLVYKTSDITEATQRGWNGSTNGTQQPSGVYFWKVRGSISSGSKVLLNGKASGSIVLVR